MALPIVWRHEVDEATYEEARVGRVFNHRRPKRYPVAVVKAEKEQHVVEAVKIAKQHGYRVSVRSGGHSWAAWSVRDNAVLIDLGNMRHMSLDEGKKLASVSPSTTGSMLNDFLGKHDLMFAGGHCPDVGLGGFLLQGGMGWNCKNWGWACERIRSLDVVTADGDLIQVDAEHNSDLFFAARGAGPGFPGVVVRFHLEVRPKVPNMLSSAFVYPRSNYREVMSWAIDIAPGFDTDTEIVVVGNTPPGINQPCIVALFVTFKNSLQECEASLESANKTRPEGFIVQDKNRPTSLAQEYIDQANANPKGHRYWADNGYVNNDADVVSALEPAFTTLPSEKSFALWYAMAPCSRREMPDMALSMQSDHYFAIYTIWKDESDDDLCKSWTKSIMKNIAERCDGAYLGDSDFQVRETKYWTDEKAKKLMAIRQQRDPVGRICGYLDAGDETGASGLRNENKWIERSDSPMDL